MSGFTPDQVKAYFKETADASAKTAAKEMLEQCRIVAETTARSTAQAVLEEFKKGYETEMAVLRDQVQRNSAASSVASRSNPYSGPPRSGTNFVPGSVEFKGWVTDFADPDSQAIDWSPEGQPFLDQVKEKLA